MRIEQCQTCRFFEVEEVNARSRRVQRCVRFPEAQLKEPDEWCGEYRADESKLCMEKGPPLPTDPSIEAARNVLASLRKVQGMPPRAPSEPYRLSCMYEKNHTERHSWDEGKP